MICSVANCDRKALARGWCGKHYQRWRTHGNPLVTLASNPPVIHPDDRYGRLTVIREAPRERGGRKFLCRCDCGATTVVRSSSLRHGKTKSCGCLHRESARAIGRRGLRDAAGYTAVHEWLERHYGHQKRACEQCGRSDGRLYWSFKGVNGEYERDRSRYLVLCASCHKTMDAMNVPRRWSRAHDACIECGTTQRKHYGHGLCMNCYMNAKYRNDERYRAYVASRNARRVMS